MNKIWAVYFSPTGNTEKLTLRTAQRLSQALGMPVEQVDLTPPGARKKEYSFGSRDLLVAGMPTYAGRLPNKILPDLQRILRGEDTPALALVTFGGRAYDSSLAELINVLTDAGYRVCAAAAVCGRHSFTDLVGEGRPDDDDLQQLDEWTDAFLQSLPDSPPLLPEGIRAEVAPYYVPLGIDGRPAKFLKATPVTDMSLCDNCGICAEVCPMGSVSPADPSVTAGVCIKCHACIRKCPRSARRFTDPAFLSHREMLETEYRRRAESRFFGEGSEPRIPVL